MTQKTSGIVSVIVLTLGQLLTASVSGQTAPVPVCSPVPSSAEGEATLGLATGLAKVVVSIGEAAPQQEVDVDISGRPEWDERSAINEARARLRRMIRQEADCQEPSIELVDFGSFDDPVATGEADFKISLPSGSKEMTIKDIAVSGTIETWTDDGEPDGIDWDWRAACPAAVDEAMKVADSARFELARGRLSARVRDESAAGACDIVAEDSGSGLVAVIEKVAITGKVTWDWEQACENAVSAASPPSSGTAASPTR